MTEEVTQQTVHRTMAVTRKDADLLMVFLTQEEQGRFLLHPYLIINYPRFCSR